MSPQIEEHQANQRFASLPMTYACTIAYDHGCSICSPNALQAAIPVDRTVKYLSQPHELDRAAHMTGGEPFKHYNLPDVIYAKSSQPRLR